MKIICQDKTINLDKFETVRYRKCYFEERYLVQATRWEKGFLGNNIVEEDISIVMNQKVAEDLSKVISEKWITEEKFFDVEKWKSTYSIESC